MEILIRDFQIDNLDLINIPINFYIMKDLLGESYLDMSGVDQDAMDGEEIIECQPLCGRRVVYCPKDGNFYIAPNIHTLKKIRDLRPKRGER
jgi:hypothetical protein